MKKVIYTLFLLFISVFCLTSCGQTNSVSAQIFETNAFRLVRQVSSDGKIGMAYVFPVNSVKLQEQGFSSSQISTFKFYLTTYVNALAQSNRAKATSGTRVETSQYFSDVDGIGFSIIFDNLEAQNLFFGVQQDNQNSQDSKYKSSGFFMKKTEVETAFPFSQKSAGDLKMLVLMAMSSWASDQNLSDTQKQQVQQILNDSVFVYDFGTTQTSLKSQLMYDDENFHHNVFIKSFEELELSSEIVFYTESVNYPVWYLLALFLVIVGMVLAYFVFKMKIKQKNITIN